MRLSKRIIIATRGLLTCLALALLSVIASAQGAGASAKPPTLFLIGDSTVRNGAGDGANKQWGWGEPIVAYFDPAKIAVLKRARGTIKGVGEETEEIDNLLTKKHEVVHSYGWYLRKYIADTKAKGATPVICSPVPRKIWKEGRIVRDQYAQWAEEVAKAEKVGFIDLNEIIARQYDAMGAEKVEPLFAAEHTHTHLPKILKFQPARCAPR